MTKAGYHEDGAGHRLGKWTAGLGKVAKQAQYSPYLAQGPVQECAGAGALAAALRIESDPWVLNGDGAL